MRKLELYEMESTEGGSIFAAILIGMAVGYIIASGIDYMLKSL